MLASVTIRTGLPRAALASRLATLTADGPFQIRPLEHVGGGVWMLTLQPRRPGLSIGFAKVAELLLLLARDVHVDAVERIAAVAATAAADDTSGRTPRTGLTGRGKILRDFFQE